MNGPQAVRYGLQPDRKTPMTRALRWTVSLTLVSIIGASPVLGQELLPASIEITPVEFDLEVGDSVQLEVIVRDASGDPIEDAPVIYLPVWGQFWNLGLRTWGFNLFKVSPDGLVSASRPGEYAVLVRVPTGDDQFIEREIALRIAKPQVTEISFVDPPTRFIAGTEVRLQTRFRDPTGAVRDDVAGSFRSSDGSVAVVDALGNMRLLSAGQATITAMADDAAAALDVRVEANSFQRLTLAVDAQRVRTGDVVRSARSKALLHWVSPRQVTSSKSLRVRKAPCPHSPRASWVVNARTKKPTGDSLALMHPDLKHTDRIITDGQDLRRCIRRLCVPCVDLEALPPL